MLAERWGGRSARRCLVAILSLGVAGTAVGSPASARGDDLIPDLQAFFAAPFSPKQLPARRTVPIHLSLLEKIKTQTGGPPPALRELDLDLDRHLGLSVLGLPSCPRPYGEYGPRTDTLAKCEEAKVGSGTVKLAVAFPEQQPVQTTGRVSVYNGGFRDSHTTFWLYAFIPAPVTGAILMPLEIRRDEQGFYGWDGVLELPKIANGSASVTDFEIGIGKGIFSARCSNGRFRARAVSRFADGSVLSSSYASNCRAAAS
jgi:hypothetical protein